MIPAFSTQTAFLQAFLGRTLEVSRNESFAWMQNYNYFVHLLSDFLILILRVALVASCSQPGESEKNLSNYSINLLEVNRQEKYLVVSRSPG